METFLAEMSHQEKQSGRALDRQTTYAPKTLLSSHVFPFVLLVDSTAAVLVSIAEQ